MMREEEKKQTLDSIKLKNRLNVLQPYYDAISAMIKESISKRFAMSFSTSMASEKSISPQSSPQSQKNFFNSMNKAKM